MPLNTQLSSKPAAVENAAHGALWPTGKRNIPAAQRIFFTEQLSLLLDTGTPLHQALTTIREQMGSSAVKAIVTALAEDVAKGSTFAAALGHHPQMFPDTYVKLIEASEGGGFMGSVLQELLHMEEQQQELKSNISSAMTYPTFLLLFSGIVIVFVLLVVFPKFSTMFDNLQGRLPLSTQVLLAVSDLLRDHWLLSIAVVSASGVAIASVLRLPQSRRAIDHLKLSVAPLSTTYQQIYLVQIMRVLSLSLRNGVSIRDALKASRSVVSNVCFRQLLDEAQEGVQKGHRLSDTLSQSNYLPALARQMIATGEETGNLAKVMGRVADYYDRELCKRLALLSRLAEPLMLIVMGMIVGVIVSSLILPILQLSRVSY